MDNHLNELIKEEQNPCEHEVYSDIAQSDIPSEIVSGEVNNEINENENKSSKGKNKVQHIVLLNKYVKKKRFTFFDWETICSKITIIILCIFPFSFVGISVADIIIQLMNLQCLNPYLIDDVLLIMSIILVIGKWRYAPAIIYLTICAYITDNVIFFQIFEPKIKSPEYVKDFYLYYIIIKFGSLGLGLSLLIILAIIECIIEIIRKKLRNRPKKMKVKY